jgi:ribosomal-protein-alanine N-acetyltransferase
LIFAASVLEAPLMAAIHARAFAEAAWDAESFRVLLGQPGVFGFVDEAGGVLLVRVVADEAEILTIGVMVPRQGVGRRLMMAGLEFLRGLDVAAVFLEVAAKNMAARGLYKGLGFVRVGERRGYLGEGGEAVVLRLGM